MSTIERLVRDPRTAYHLTAAGILTIVLGIALLLSAYPILLAYAVLAAVGSLLYWIAYVAATWLLSDED